MRIAALVTIAPVALHQAAELLVVGFAEHWPDAWPNLDAARLTVRESLSPARIARAALDDAGSLLGWAAAEPLYNGNVWELTVLVVRPSVTTRVILMSFTGRWGFQLPACCRTPTVWVSQTFSWRNRWRGGKFG